MTIRIDRPVLSALAAMATVLAAGCGSKSETEVASGTFTDPETGETAEYKVSGGEDGEDGKVVVKTADGEVRFGGDASDVKLPIGMTPYPGSKIAAGFGSSGKDGQSSTSSFEVKAKLADVMAHYRKQIEGAGMKVSSEMNTDDAMILSAQKPGDDKTSVQITASQDEGLVEGAITYSSGG